MDHHNAEEMKREADAVIDRNHIKYIIFDFEKTDFMDSSGIGVIMGRYKTICLIGGEVWGSACKCENQKNTDIVRCDENYADI